MDGNINNNDMEHIVNNVKISTIDTIDMISKYFTYNIFIINKDELIKGCANINSKNIIIILDNDIYKPVWRKKDGSLFTFHNNDREIMLLNSKIENYTFNDDFSESETIECINGTIDKTEIDYINSKKITLSELKVKSKLYSIRLSYIDIDGKRKQKKRDQLVHDLNNKLNKFTNITT
jgi:hypothetical protein